MDFVDSAGDGVPPGSREPRRRHLLPYEPRLVAWHLRRWRSGRKYDVAKTEHDNGREYVRLFAAYCVGRKLQALTGCLVPVVVIGFALGVSDGWPALLAGSVGVVVSFAVWGIGMVRMFQADKSRKEYQQARLLTPQ